MSQIPLSMMPPNGFVFTEPEGRPFRAISIEIEVDGDGKELATALHKKGLSYTPRVERFGWHPPNGYKHPGFLKSDASVTGGELVLDRINLTNETHAEALMSTLRTLRALEKDGKIQYNPNCGGHMHIDCHGFGMFDTVRLLDYFGYIEELICRLAGSGKTYGHRTLFKGHDTANHGAGYTNPVIKGPFRQLPRDLRVITQQDRMSCLNFSHYTQAGCGRDCSGVKQHVLEGGAYIYDYKACTHIKPFNTIEWRVWNSQGNPRTLYAWIAVMQALHAYSWRPADATAYTDVENLEPLAWEKKPWSKLTTATKRAVQDRIVWMFTELPLSSEEKDALAYAYMRTPYKEFGQAWFKQLANEPYKATKYPMKYSDKVSRKVEIVPFDEAQGTERDLEAPPEALVQEAEDYIVMEDDVPAPYPPNPQEYAGIRLYTTANATQEQPPMYNARGGRAAYQRQLAEYQRLLRRQIMTPDQVLSEDGEPF